MQELEQPAVSKTRELYDLSALGSQHLPKATLKLLADRRSTFIDNSFRCKLSAVSARTLDLLLEKYPADLNTRAGLIAYYGERCELQNKFGINPDLEFQFVLHLGWFIKYALGAEGLTSARIPELSAKARDTLLQLLKQQTSKTLSKVAIKNKKYFQDQLRVKTEEEKVLRAKSRAKWGRIVKEPGALDGIALKCDKPNLKKFVLPKSYSVTEWSNDSHLAHGGLTGSYRWFVKDFALRLDEVMESDSLDLYHRALIIGNYRSDERDADRTQMRALYEKHMLWLITNCPGSIYFRYFFWDDIEKVDYDLKAKLNRAWIKQVKISNDPQVFINASLAHFSNDRATAKTIIDKALEIAPRNLTARALRSRLAERQWRPAPEIQLKKLGFKHGYASKRLTTFVERFDTADAELFGINIPERAVWTLEQVLQNNANDLVARAEIMGFLHNYRYCNAIEGREPARSEQHLVHELWWIQNIPAMPRMRLFRGDDGEEQTGKLTVAAAWKMQLDSYPHEPDVAVNASRVFFLDSSGCEYGIGVIKSALRLNPKNSKLKKRLRDLRDLDGRIRS